MQSFDLETALALVSALGVAFAIVYAVRGGKRSDRQDITKDAEQTARIESKLDSVRAGVDDIRVEMRTQQKQLNDHETRLTRIETRHEMKGE